MKTTAQPEMYQLSIIVVATCNQESIASMEQSQMQQLIVGAVGAFKSKTLVRRWGQNGDQML